MSLGSYFICIGVIAPFIYLLSFFKNVNAAHRTSHLERNTFAAAFAQYDALHYVAIGRYLASFA